MAILQAAIVPEGHVIRGTATWRFTDERGGSRGCASKRASCNFQMPPIIGP